MYGFVAWFEDVTSAGSGVSLVRGECHCVPVDVSCALRHGHSGDKGAVADENDAWNRVFADTFYKLILERNGNSLIATVVDLVGLIVYPFALRKIDGAAVAFL